MSSSEKCLLASIHYGLLCLFLPYITLTLQVMYEDAIPYGLPRLFCPLDIAQLSELLMGFNPLRAVPAISALISTYGDPLPL